MTASLFAVKILPTCGLGTSSKDQSVKPKVLILYLTPGSISVALIVFPNNVDVPNLARSHSVKDVADFDL